MKSRLNEPAVKASALRELRRKKSLETLLKHKDKCYNNMQDLMQQISKSSMYTCSLHHRTGTDSEVMTAMKSGTAALRAINAVNKKLMDSGDVMPNSDDMALAEDIDDFLKTTAETSPLSDADVEAELDRLIAEDLESQLTINEPTTVRVKQAEPETRQPEPVVVESPSPSPEPVDLGLPQVPSHIPVSSHVMLENDVSDDELELEHKMNKMAMAY